MIETSSAPATNEVTPPQRGTGAERSGQSPRNDGGSEMMEAVWREMGREMEAPSLERPTTPASTSQLEEGPAAGRALPRLESPEVTPEKGRETNEELDALIREQVTPRPPRYSTFLLASEPSGALGRSTSSCDPKKKILRRWIARLRPCPEGQLLWTS